MLHTLLHINLELHGGRLGSSCTTAKHGSGIPLLRARGWARHGGLSGIIACIGVLHTTSRSIQVHRAVLPNKGRAACIKLWSLHLACTISSCTIISKIWHLISTTFARCQTLLPNNTSS